MVSAVSTSSAALSAALQRFDGAAARAVNTAVLKSSIESEKRVLDILV